MVIFVLIVKKILTYIAKKRTSIGKGHTKRGPMNPDTLSNFSMGSIGILRKLTL